MFNAGQFEVLFEIVLEAIAASLIVLLVWLSECHRDKPGSSCSVGNHAAAGSHGEMKQPSLTESAMADEFDGLAAREWLLANLDQAGKPDLVRMLGQAKAAGYEPKNQLKNNPARRNFLRAVRERHWGKQSEKRLMPSTELVTTGGFRDEHLAERPITASEANAFLRGEE